MLSEDDEKLDVVFKSIWKDEYSLEEAMKEAKVLDALRHQRFGHSPRVYALAGDEEGDRLFMISQ